MFDPEGKANSFFGEPISSDLISFLLSFSENPIYETCSAPHRFGVVGREDARFSGCFLFGRVRFVPGFGELNIEFGFNLG